MANYTYTPEEIDALIEKYAKKYGVDPDFARAMSNIESSGNVNAKNPKSSATGLFQLVKGTAKELGVDPNIPEENIDGGIRYLARMLDKADGDPREAGLMYHDGPNYDEPSKDGINHADKFVAEIQKLKQLASAPGEGNFGDRMPQFSLTGKYRAPQQSSPVPVTPEIAPNTGGSANTFDALRNISRNPRQDMTEIAMMEPQVSMESSYSNPAPTKTASAGFSPVGVKGFMDAPMSSMKNAAGELFSSPMGAAGAAFNLATTDWEDPESIGASAGSMAGSTAGMAIGGPVGAAIGGVVGDLGGGAIGGLFGDSKAEEEEKKRKEQQETQAIIGSLDHLQNISNQGSQQMMANLRNLSKYWQQGNAAAANLYAQI